MKYFLSHKKLSAPFFTDLFIFNFTMMNTSMPVVLLTIANSDGVHILTRFFREARKKNNVKSAVETTLQSLFLPIFLTSFTTSIAFLAFLCCKANEASANQRLAFLGFNSFAFDNEIRALFNCLLDNLHYFRYSMLSVNNPSIFAPSKAFLSLIV